MVSPVPSLRCAIEQEFEAARGLVDGFVQSIPEGYDALAVAYHLAVLSAGVFVARLGEDEARKQMAELVEEMVAANKREALEPCPPIC